MTTNNVPQHLRWTEEEDSLIRESLGTLSYSQIAAALSVGDRTRTRTAVAGRVRRLKILDRPPEEREALLEADRVRRRETRANPGRARPRAKPRPPRTPVERSNVKPTIAKDKRQPRWVASSAPLPSLTTKEGRLLHVYSRDPHVLKPLASYERRGDFWVNREDPSQRFESRAEAVGALAP